MGQQAPTAAVYHALGSSKPNPAHLHDTAATKRSRELIDWAMNASKGIY